MFNEIWGDGGFALLHWFSGTCFIVIHRVRLIQFISRFLQMLWILTKLRESLFFSCLIYYSFLAWYIILTQVLNFSNEYFLFVTFKSNFVFLVVFCFCFFNVYFYLKWALGRITKYSSLLKVSRKKSQKILKKIKELIQFCWQWNGNVLISIIFKNTKRTWCTIGKLILV